MIENAELKAEVALLRGALEWYALGGPVYSVFERKESPTFSMSEARRAKEALTAPSGEALAAVRRAACALEDADRAFTKNYLINPIVVSNALAELKRIFGDA